MKLIQTKDYLLLIDEEADKTGYIFAKDTNIVFQDLSEGDKRGIKQFPQLYDKVVAYYPLTKEAKELDLTLLPNPFEEVDIEKEALDVSELKNRWGHLYTFGYPSKPYPTGFQHDLDMIMLGLYKSKSKQFSLEDVKKAIRDSAYTIDPQLLGTDEYDIEENRIIQSLSTQQLPKEFIPEYYTNGDMIVKNRNGVRELIGTYKY